MSVKSQLQVLKQEVSRVGKSPTLINVLDECLALLDNPEVDINEYPNDVNGHKLDGTGNGIRLYLPSPAKKFVFNVNYNKKNLGNLVHEMTHCCVEVAYLNHFLNYPVNVNTQSTIIPKVDQHGNCLNNSNIVKQLRNSAPEKSRANKIKDLQLLFNQCAFKFDEKLVSHYGPDNIYTHSKKESREIFKSKVDEKLKYALGPPQEGQGGGPHIDYDTVINHLLVWMFQFGYPVKKGIFASKEPPENLFFRKLENLADENLQLRKIHRRHNSALNATEHDKYKRVVT